ncbi:hypothetical protein PPO43_12430 [Saprospira sp. CCB-QB6]|uniref:hypothetical protein n=1 Tax=Saprospira sp. CCB-QB6 TaxID=3023936 RepID=UPI00234AD21A|nr:hypothetical protein [Saprospira sp. CCB-QB6]WCL80777.1 hypothetical protein PPO43_12430 [Saprospira sp. CCB-QB6]
MIRIFSVLICCLFLFTACDQLPKGEDVSTAEDEIVDEQLPELEVKEYKVVEPPQGCQLPKTVADLSSGLKKIFYQFNDKNQASLALFGKSMQLGKKEVVVIVDYMQYKDMDCDEDKSRYGVGVRLFLHIEKANRKIDLNNLPQLAANVQLGRASVRYVFQTIGVTGPKINDLLPKSNTNTFDVEGYANVIHAVDQVQSLIRDGIEGVNIAPQAIPTN